MNYSRYLKPSGRIDALYDFPSEEAMQHNISAHHDFVEGVFDAETQYVVDGVIVERPTSQAIENKSHINADGADQYVVSNINPESEIRLLGPVTDLWIEQSSTVNLTVNVPGIYRIIVNQFPMQDFVSSFNAS